MGRSRTESPRIVAGKFDSIRTRMAGENLKTKETRGDRTIRFSRPPRTSGIDNRDRPSSTSGLSPIPVGSRGHSRPAKRPRPDTGEVKPMLDPKVRDRGYSRPPRRPKPEDRTFTSNRPEKKDRNIAEQDI